MAGLSEDGERAAAQAPRPIRISLLRRLLLRRQGARDGRLGLPDLEFGVPPLTTEARLGLESRFCDAAEGMWIEYLEHVAYAQQQLLEVDQELAELGAALQTTSDALAELPEPDPANPVRRTGEQDRPDDLVHRRRQRDQRRAAAPLRAKLGLIQVAIRKAETRRDGIENKTALRHQTTLARGERLLATFQRERRIYDGALIRCHPARDLVIGALDPSVPTLPAWWDTVQAAP